MDTPPTETYHLNLLKINSIDHIQVVLNKNQYKIKDII